MRDVVRVLQDYLQLNKKQVELEEESKTKEQAIKKARNSMKSLKKHG